MPRSKKVSGGNSSRKTTKGSVSSGSTRYARYNVNKTSSALKKKAAKESRTKRKTKSSGRAR